MAEGMWLWLCAFVILAVVEGVTYSLVSIWFCFGAVAAFIATALGVTFDIQLICFGAVSALTMALLRPYARKKWAPKNTKTSLDRMLDMTATVIEEVTDTTGAVKVDGKEWNARTGEPDGIPVGEVCKVLMMSGNKLIVVKK